jgi:hypothetical protein
VEARGTQTAGAQGGAPPGTQEYYNETVLTAVAMGLFCLCVFKCFTKK